MSKEPKDGPREGKVGFQVFIDPLVVQRFRAACALTGDGQTTIAEKLMMEYADSMGIPAQIPVPPKRKSPRG